MESEEALPREEHFLYKMIVINRVDREDDHTFVLFKVLI